MLERFFETVAMDFDTRDWKAIAFWLVAAQAVLVLIALGVDRLWFPDTPYGLFTGHVFLDALSVGMRRPLLWAAGLTFAPPVGAIIYSRRRVEYRRLPL